MKTASSRLARSALFAVLSAAGVAAFAATDFSALSNEELVQLRTQAQTMGEEDRLRYREELQKRAQTMTPEERSRLGVGRDDAAGQGTHTRERTRAGEDNERGRGETNRERQRAENGNGYGRGYEARQKGSQGAGMSGGRGMDGGMGAAVGGRGR